MDVQIQEVDAPGDDEFFEGEGESFEVPEKEPPVPEVAQEVIPETPKESPVNRVLAATAPCERAFIENQYFQYPDSLVFTGKKVYVLDMTRPEDLETYERLQTENADPDFGLTIDYEDIKFSEKTDSWKIFLLVSEHKFLPISNAR